MRCLVFVRHSDLAEQALALCEAPQLMVDVTGCGPNAALQLLRQTLPSDASSRLEWCRRAKIAAIVGSCPKSRDSFRSGPPFACTILRHGLASRLSGIRNWISFAEVALGGAQFAFPPSLEGIIAWSHAFRCVGTYANYLGYLRSACLALDLDVPPANHLAIQRAKIAIVKRMLFTPRCGF